LVYGLEKGWKSKKVLKIEKEFGGILIIKTNIYSEKFEKKL